MIGADRARWSSSATDPNASGTLRLHPTWMTLRCRVAGWFIDWPRGGARGCCHDLHRGQPAGQPLSAAARHVHWEWRLGDDHPYAIRRKEDEAGCRVLDAEPLHLGFLDAIYRHDAGAPLYTRYFMDGVPHPEDLGEFLTTIKVRLQPLVDAAEQVYGPLTLGGHVDHILVRRRRLRRWRRRGCVTTRTIRMPRRPAWSRAGPRRADCAAHPSA